MCVTCTIDNEECGKTPRSSGSAVDNGMDYGLEDGMDSGLEDGTCNGTVTSPPPSDVELLSYSELRPPAES